RPAEAARMRLAIEETGVEQRFDLVGGHWTVGDAFATDGDFDHRLEPEQAARTGTDDFSVDLAAAQRGHDRPFNVVGAERQCGSVARNENARARHGWRTRSIKVSRRLVSRRPNTWLSSIAAGAQAHRPRQNTGSSDSRLSVVVSCQSTSSFSRACAASASAPID